VDYPQNSRSHKKLLISGANMCDAELLMQSYAISPEPLYCRSQILESAASVADTIFIQLTTGFTSRFNFEQRKKTSKLNHHA
jgi:hypothetical protein